MYASHSLPQVPTALAEVTWMTPTELPCPGMQLAARDGTASSGSKVRKSMVREFSEALQWRAASYKAGPYGNGDLKGYALQGPGHAVWSFEGGGKSSSSEVT